MLSHSDILAADMAVLLDRVFTGNQLTFFGEDGAGQHGRSTFPVTCNITDFSVGVTTFSDDVAEVEADVTISLDGYDSTVTGHAITDHNLRISLNKLLSAQEIDVDALDWADVASQGPDFIRLKINAQKLLSW